MFYIGLIKLVKLWMCEILHVFNRFGLELLFSILLDIFFTNISLHLYIYTCTVALSCRLLKHIDICMGKYNTIESFISVIFIGKAVFKLMNFTAPRKSCGWAGGLLRYSNDSHTIQGLSGTTCITETPRHTSEHSFFTTYLWIACHF